jgi:hypothetical protein
MGQEEAGAGGGPIPTATGRRLRSTSAGRDCHKFQQVYSADPYTFFSPLSWSLPVAQEYFAGPSAPFRPKITAATERADTG